MTDTSSTHGQPPTGEPSDRRIDAEAYDRYLIGQATEQDLIDLDRWATTEHRQRLLHAQGETHLPPEDRTARALMLLRARLGFGELASPRRIGMSHGGVRWWQDERSKSSRAPLLRRGLWFAGVTAVVAGAILLVRRVPERYTDVTRVYATTAQQQAVVDLADGTRVTLAPQTTLRVQHFGTQSRTVDLESGEAYFEVAHTTGRPFTVRSGAATATVLGTAFLVRHRAGDPHVHVAVTEGRVQVADVARTKTRLTLTAGQIGDVTDSTIQQSSTDDLASGAEWEPGRIVFRHTPVTTVLQTLSQWYGYHFRYADNALGAQSITIVVSTHSSAEALAAIERVLTVNLTVVGDTVTLVPQAPQTRQSAPRLRTYDVWTPTKEVGR